MSISGATAAASVNVSRRGIPESLSRSGSMPPTPVTQAVRKPASGENPIGFTATAPTATPSPAEKVTCVRNPAMGVLSPSEAERNYTSRNSVSIPALYARIMGCSDGGCPVKNTMIARKLRTHAHELERKKENLYRVRAFRRAAEAVLRLDEPIEEIIAHGGPAALAAVPGIGPSLATTIMGYATFGVWVTRTMPATERV